MSKTKKENKTSSANDPENKVDITATDGGDVTQDNFRFQHMCTALIAFDMYRNETEYEELFCELYEDVTAVKSNGHYVAIQIKHRENRYGPFTITNQTIQKVIQKFLKLDQDYPNKFDKFVIMSNAEILSYGRNSIQFLIDFCKKQKQDDAVESKLLDLLNKISDKWKISIPKLKTIFEKIECVTVPDHQYLMNHIVTNNVRLIQECERKNILELQNIVKILTDLIGQKSRTVSESLKIYFAFQDNSEIKHEFEEINGKRLTKNHVKNIISESETTLYLKSENKNKPKIGSLDLIDLKMNLGGINEEEIKATRMLTHNVIEYFLEQHHKDDELNLNEDLEHLQNLIKNESAKAETSARLKPGNFGCRKLNILNKKIDELDAKRNNIVKRYEPEIVKGVLGLLVTQCEVAFSNKPKGGFT